MKLFIVNQKYSSWSLRPWMVMKHFAIPFEQTVIPMTHPDTRERILAVSPSGRLPALQDGAISVWDSLAICEYLAERFPEKKLWPVSPRERALARSMAAEMHSSFVTLRNECSMKVLADLPEFRPSDGVLEDLKRLEQMWRNALECSGGPYLFGEYTIADAMFAPVAFRVQSYHLPLTSIAKNYVATLLAHPAMAEWKAAAAREPWSMQRYGD